MSIKNHLRKYILIFCTLVVLAIAYLLLSFLPQASLWIASVSWNL